MVFIANPSFAQDDFEDDYYEIEEAESERYLYGILLNIDFNWSQPISETHKSLPESLFSFNSDFLYQFDKSKPVFVGLNFLWGRYDKAYVEYYDYVDIEEFLFRKTTTFNLLTLEAKMRYFPGFEIGCFEPYFESGVGPRNSYSFTNVLNVDLEESSSFRFEDNDWELGYSIGIGSLISIGVDEEYVFGHFGMSYLGATNTFFYLEKEDGVSGFEDPIDRFERKSIPVHFLKFNFGLIFYF